MKTICIQFLLLASILSAGAQTPVYLDPQAPVDSRVNDLISKMTLDEKVGQMQFNAPAIPRLHVAEYCWSSEGLHGVAFNGLATCFPQAIGLAAMWNRQLMHEVASTISDEARAKYNIAIRKGQHGNHQGLTFWSPNINIFRDPRWGRGQETYGEDPFLTGQMAVQFIQGMQGDDPRYYKVIATAKHFAVHSGPEPIRHKMNTNVSEYDLRETYLPAFKRSVTEGKCGSLMCAYNSLNGKACCGNDPLLNSILRNEWGFNGYVVSDCGAIADIYKGHHQARDAAAASAMAVQAGTDLECGSEYAYLIKAVKAGLISEAAIDTSVKRLFTARIKLGMFDPPAMVPYSQMGTADLDNKKNHEVALKAARESVVLLKNDKNILPLKKDINTIAVIGPNANDTVVLLGNYNSIPSHAVTPLEGIRRAVSAKTKVLYEPGCALAAKTKAENGMEKSAVEAAMKADAVVLCMGISPRLEGEEMHVKIDGFEGGDRTSLDLPATQENLIKKIVAVGKPVILVLINGSALSINWENENIPGIVETWYGGQAAGTALAEVLFGDYNPSGRLPVTFYKSVSQLPDFKDYNMKGRTYRYFNGEVLYPFGYGLSYTNFELSHLQAAGSVKETEAAKVSLEVKNTGAQPGAEVIELYVKGKGLSANDAIKTLKGFEKVFLKPGETKTVQFEITPELLTFYEEGTGFKLEKGERTLLVGTSSADADLKEVRVMVK
jgi:beta-glucosidase